MYKTIQNIFFLFNASWIILFELFLYGLFKNYDSFIDRLTHKLANINILYVNFICFFNYFTIILIMFDILIIKLIFCFFYLFLLLILIVVNIFYF